MPVEHDRINFANSQLEGQPPTQRGSHSDIHLDNATIYVFCPQDDKEGVLTFSGKVEDLTYSIGDEVKVIEPGQSLIVTKDPLIICDDKVGLVFRHTNVLATSHKVVRAK